MANKETTPTPVKLRGEWLTLTKIVEMLKPLYSRDMLRNRAINGNAPFPIVQIGSRYYARREDVEAYIEQLNNK